MKNRFNRTLSILCAVMLLISAVSVWAAAEEEPASPTNLNPAEGEINPEEPVEGTEQEPAENPEEDPAEEPAEESEEEPEEEPVTEPEPEEEPAGDPVNSVEMVITRALAVGQGWEGTVSREKPVVLKLDVAKPGHVYVLIEGTNIWVTKEKSDRLTEDPFRLQPDPETEQLLLHWEAEEASYLITLGPVEPSQQAKAKVTTMNKTDYEAWVEKQAEPEAEEKSEEEPEDCPEMIETPEAETETEAATETEPTSETEPVTETEEKTETEAATETEPEMITEEGAAPQETTEEPEQGEETEEPEEEPGTEPEEGQTEENEPESESAENENNTEKTKRHIDVQVVWDVPDPNYGDTAHFVADMSEYEGLNYYIQWQYSMDGVIWNDIPQETKSTLDVVIDEVNNMYDWRILVFLVEEQE